MSGLRFRHALIIGVGLIGGSLARAMRRAGLVERISGVGRSKENLERARCLGIIDARHESLAEAFRHEEFDLIVVAVPMGEYDRVFGDLARYAEDGMLITDVGSTKRHAIEVAEKHLGSLECFVPAHPIAGTERSGAAASFAELFDHRWCILTPLASTKPQALQQIEQLWAACGARVVCMDAGLHDELLAGVSHLPHLAAYALVNAVRRSTPAHCEHDPFAFAAGGFRDFTRIASSSPEMWRDIVLANADALVPKIDALQRELSELSAAIKARDGRLLLERFSAAKAARDGWLTRYGGDL
ncbi:MAG: prephenate dehydrogenase/arogenate dehydrogenase family protein [Zetaproteobacteria bacterium]|nr:MAG: prephenate dehydrogenase/arogenate dehydrogenase family protein [Zetaproteobacteria bacterium]